MKRRVLPTLMVIVLLAPTAAFADPPAPAKGGADPAAAQRSSGYVVGGISPLGQRTRQRTVVDESALAYETVLVSGGRRGLQLELAPAELVRLTDAVVADIGRPS